MSETVFVLTKYEALLVVVAIVTLAVGCFFGWLKGYEDGIAAGDKEKEL